MKTSGELKKSEISSSYSENSNDEIPLSIVNFKNNQDCLETKFSSSNFGTGKQRFSQASSASLSMGPPKLPNQFSVLHKRFQDIVNIDLDPTPEVDAAEEVKPKVDVDVPKRESFEVNVVKQRTLHEKKEEIDVFKEGENVKNDKITKKSNSILNFMSLYLESKAVAIALFTVTLFALYGNDIKDIFFDKSSDLFFDSVIVFCMVFYFIEIIFSIIVRKKYLFSFFFFLDVLSTLSLLLDVSFIGSLPFLELANNVSSLARAGRASRMASRAARVLSIIRVIKFKACFKLFKRKSTEAQIKSIAAERSRSKSGSSMIDRQLSSPSSTEKSKRASILSPTKPLTIGCATPLVLMKRADKFASTIKIEPVMESSKFPPASKDEPLPNEEIVEDKAKTRESRVGKKMTDLTTKRVIVVVLLILFMIPLLSYEFFFRTWLDQDVNLYYLNEMINTFNVTNESLASICKEMIVSNPKIFIFKIDIDVFECNYISPEPFSNIRASALFNTTLESSPTPMYILSDNREEVVLSAWLNIGKTTIICLILMLASFLFSRDANVLVLQPIERMIDLVNRLARNPLSTREEKLKVIKQDKNENYETHIIENAILKIGKLLALGFGDAGSEIVAKNLMSGKGDIDPLIPGKKQFSIYGFCDIRNFTDATEILQEEVMIFVNNIAEIVHTMVDRYQGSANKNIGDAFLLVWKFDDEDIFLLPSGDMTAKPTINVNNICDLSLISFIKIIAKINKSPKLRKYRSDPRLNARIPDYRVKMGFGLHLGWSIEGAIGSEYKIDASYLSPNVNLASRLEAATKQYGVPILISSSLHEHMSSQLQNYCRKIDIVTVKGSINPIGLYTIDLEYDFFEAGRDDQQSKETKSLINKIKKDEISQLLQSDSLIGLTIFREDREIRSMISWAENITFQQTFSEGFVAYIYGNWELAKIKFEQCRETIRSDDGPSTTLLHYMSDYGYRAPENWKGYRELTEK